MLEAAAIQGKLPKNNYPASHILCSGVNTDKPNTMEKLLAVTAIGPDRTGLVKDLSEAISSSGGSILQSRMTTLGQEFAMLVLVTANWHAITKVEEALAKLQENVDLTITTRITSEQERADPAIPYSIDIVSIDQEGIVARLAAFFAERTIEIADLHTRQYNAAHTGSAMFSVQLVVNLPASTHLAGLRDEFHEFCEQHNLDAIIEHIQR